MMKAVDEMKKIFIKVLYIEMKYIKRSMYLTQNTIKYNSWVLQERPISYGKQGALMKEDDFTYAVSWLPYSV